MASLSQVSEYLRPVPIAPCRASVLPCSRYIKSPTPTWHTPYLSFALGLEVDQGGHNEYLTTDLNIHWDPKLDISQLPYKFDRALVALLTEKQARYVRRQLLVQVQQLWPGLVRVRPWTQRDTGGNLA